EYFITTTHEDLKKYNAIGIGPGMGTNDETELALEQIVLHAKAPLVLDADALNLLATAKRVLRRLPPGTILTPHPKEADRLFGESRNDFERLELVRQKAAELNCIIVLKGHHTFIALPNGQGYFNSTGNAGMAKGGSGDVLTGIITSLLAQGYSAAEAAILGVYLHGLAGDEAAKAFTMEAMLPSDLVQLLPQAFAFLQQHQPKGK
ncbi:MAG: NAD(P)H-hydrate dehydratase, partial [Chitinophagaceae bacterium]